jgi:hypothetical protein
MLELTAQDLRQIIGSLIEHSIEHYRDSMTMRDMAYKRKTGPVTEEEIDDFVYHIPMIDSDVREQLLIPSFLGFMAKKAKVSQEWLDKFKKDISVWSEDNSWIGADDSTQVFGFNIPSSEDGDIWYPNQEMLDWVDSSGTYSLITAELSIKGHIFSKLSGDEFEKTAGLVLKEGGWTVDGSNKTVDGGVNVLASKEDPVSGLIQSLWQAKRIDPEESDVQLNEVRELSVNFDGENAKKEILLTTIQLTKNELAWMKNEVYVLPEKESNDVVDWMRGKVLE